MIDGLNIENFQSHKDTSLAFHKGMNVIVGPTDSGKSAILRALNWVVWNSPSGKAFRSHWGGLTKVEAQLDGKLVVRSKDTTDLYKIDKSEFKAFGVKPLDEVSTVFNMDEVNLQKQLDSPFLLSETSGYVATYLNRIANIAKIDTSTKAIKSDVRKTKQLIEAKEKDLAKKVEDLANYDSIALLRKSIQKAEKLEKKLDAAETEEQILTSVIDNINELTDQIKEVDEFLQHAQDLDAAIIKINDRDAVNRKLSKLNYLLSDIHDTTAEIAANEEIQNNASLIETAIDLKNQQSNLSIELATLNSIVTNTLQTQVELKTSEDNLEIATNKYNTKFKQLKICPTCGSNLKNHGKRH